MAGLTRSEKDEKKAGLTRSEKNEKEGWPDTQ
jgi:hypothetical protein